TASKCGAQGCPNAAQGLENACASPIEDIQVAVDGNMVTLRAEVKQQDSTSQDEKVLRSERYYGAVSRSFQLSSDIDQTQAKAKYDNGVLTLTLPKKQAMSGAQRLTIE
ncbi:Hsp20/alpha crystallin family protein, partial [Rhodoferax sp.]|uniref:Hsp20/alpha crystallin family protein n=1 Tax=Rhodoferax sp. TaxID=50421 RepID=UPI0025CB7CC2